RARDLVDQILAISRKTKQEKKPLQVTPVLKEVVKFLRATLPSTVKIVYDLMTENDIVNCDPTQIHQVLMNLCTNSGHAMKAAGGVLEIRMRQTLLTAENVKDYRNLRPGPYLAITVSDTGYGIAKQHLNRIFDPYFTTKQLGEGTGLGLAVTNGIVKDLGGAIRVESEPGQGTQCEVLLPLSGGAVDAQTEELTAFPHGTERILFVDDEV
ncbi:MAG: hybrid sensor histidine kinase/response regulator, partial [Deltaproteobacteria bacterium]|nr:hybrid sensor histidine kinase/response regulator [Deltaproteobacteria bacterium]